MGAQTLTIDSPRRSSVLERRRRLVLAAGIAGLAIAILVWWLPGRGSADVGPTQIPGEGNRVTVEVLNATTIDGLARRVTSALRRKGVDVVFYGSAETTEPESTLVIARTDDSVAVRVVRDALGIGVVSVAPAPQLLLDVTVVLGRDAESVVVSTRN